ncbi:hypothetical protein GLOIN_2v1488880 [Rhizophagus clarus]|uniref:Uncharacterized protein n=1 Tax=Rhizophagus clarus TaxID=94130 RepID=A0A8H3LMQ3_9GLOM|nr:hypothetical protein GLOIN_2v1488880 [Rhizophagus clarus]
MEFSDTQLHGKKYREGTGNKRSLVGEKLYGEFSTKFWLKPESQFGQACSESVKGSSRVNSSSRSSNTRTSDIADLFETPPPVSRPVMPSVEASTSSRPTTPTLPSFSQSVNVINITINNH